MKTARIHQYGSVEATVTLDDIEPPIPGPAEVLVEIEAASVNPLDAKLVSGNLQSRFPLPLPYAVGLDFSGTVITTGSAVATLDPGTSVFGRSEPSPGQGHEYGGGGAFSEMVCVPARFLTTAPQNLELETLAAIPTAAGTAWQALLEVAGLTYGRTVLIQGASGGVGHFAVQLAKLVGAYVIATTSSKNLAFVSSLGADQVIDYEDENALLALDKVDVVLDTVGAAIQERSFPLLRPGGVLVTTANPPSPELATQHKVTASRIGHQTDGNRLSLLAGLVAAGHLQIHISERFSLDRVRDALTLIERGHTRGKILLSIQ